MSEMRNCADRIEAAQKREREATCKESLRVGNAAKTLEALEQAQTKIQKMETADEVYCWYERYVQNPDKAKEPKMPFGVWLLHALGKAVDSMENKEEMK